MLGEQPPPSNSTELLRRPAPPTRRSRRADWVRNQVRPRPRTRLPRGRVGDASPARLVTRVRVQFGDQV
jgi:hypothetical protein